MRLSGDVMRFLLVLLALVSGLSLADVAVAATPAELVGRADCVAVAAVPEAIACPARAHLQRAVVRTGRTVPLAPVDAGFATACGVTIADQPDE